MPNLALSKTARTLNSWSPMHGGDTIGESEMHLKDDPGTIINNNNELCDDTAVPRPAFRPTSFDIKSNRRKQNRLLTTSRAMFELTEGSGRGPVVANGHDNYAFINDVQGFAPQPRPGYVSPPVQFNNNNNNNNNDDEVTTQNSTPVPGESIPSTNNRDVRFQVRGTPLIRGQRLSNQSSNVSLKYIWFDPSIGVETPLILANSTESLAHLRKWNSQTCLRANKTLTKSEPGNNKTPRMISEFPDARVKRVLKRNASLPDLRQAKQLDSTKLYRARPRNELSDNQLIRTPSDTGRALSFWMASEDDHSARGNGTIKSFVETPAVKRGHYESKLLVFRNHWFNKKEELNVKYQGKKNTNEEDYSKDENSSDMSDFSAKTLADELTLLGRELLLAVEPVELVTYVMKPRVANEETCPNLFRLLRFYERVTALVATEVLRSDNSTKRSQILALIIEAAEKCRMTQNWQSTKALMAGIQCPPVARLQDSWAQLRQQYPDHNSTFESLVNEEFDRNETDLEKPRRLAAMPYFGEVLSRVRGRPTVSRLRPARPLWKEPPSLAKWVEEQIAIALSCDTCHSTVHKNRACCYLMVLVLGKNFFCPVRRMPEAFVQNKLTANAECADTYNFRLDLAKVFDDPESLPFTSTHIQCSALQPQYTMAVRQRAEIYLRSAQATARAYDLESHPKARHYLLLTPYNSLIENMKRSLVIESTRGQKNL